ncbi:hypothetical protein ACROYT_G044269 [Oculina patagonica]
MQKELLIFGLLVLYISNIHAELQLQQAVVISRHGSRTLLTKDHKTFEEGADSQITIRGMDQMFRAGSFVQKRYQKDSFLSDVYYPQDIYVRSSDYSRTLNSASSFLLGLYPPRNQTLNVSYAGVFYAPYNIQQVPIHTVAVENDQVLRGWLECPELQKRLATFYKSTEFQKKESESAELRKQLEGIVGIEKIELKDFYNVYDFIHLHQLYNQTYLNITEDQWTKVVYLADWVEYKKYSKEMVGDIGGGLLANEIASSFSKVAAKQSKTKLLYYSAHYPTMFSLFSALGLNQASDSPLRTIPYYASLAFVELLRDSKDSSKLVVQFSFKNGLEEPLKKYSIPGCKDPCPLDQFVELVKSLKVRDVASWCHACSNSQLSRCQVTPQSECPTVKEPTVSGTGGFFLGVFVTLLLVIFITALWHFCLRKRCFPGGDGRRPQRGLADLENVPATGVI